MSGARLHTLLPELATRQPVMVVGAAVIDVIADAYALPWRGCDIELKQQSVNVGGCALNIAVALKRQKGDRMQKMVIPGSLFAEMPYVPPSIKMVVRLWLLKEQQIPLWFMPAATRRYMVTHWIPR